MTTKSDANIAALAVLFPATFAAEPWQAHRYVDRLMYQKCLAAGGARVDLERKVSGEVSREQRCRADKLVLRIKAHQLAAVGEAESKKAVGQTATPR